jgi:hypothetical protein
MFQPLVTAMQVDANQMAPARKPFTIGKAASATTLLQQDHIYMNNIANWLWLP